MIALIPRGKPRTILVGILCYALLSACSNAEDPAQAGWLHGDWELSFNPQHDDSDLLVFRKDGTVTVKTFDGRNIKGHYTVTGRDLALILMTPKKQVDVGFTVSPDHKKLIYKTGAYYTHK